jgi:Ca-activated chloride channel family protein
LSFAAPAFLLALLLVPLAAALYLQSERGRGRAERAFASPRTLPSVVPNRPGWRRHAPMIAFWVALAVLAIALARPERTVAVPDERSSVVLVTDQSGSMAAKDVQPTRLEAARQAADHFLDQVPKRVRVGLVAFNNGVQAIKAPTVDRGDVRGTIDRISPSGGTATGDALATALGLLERQANQGTLPGAPQRQRPPGAIVLLSDGKATHGQDPVPVARRAGRMKVPVYTVALGTPQGTIQVPRVKGQGTRTQRVPPDPQTLRRIAQVSGGQAYEAKDADELDTVYKRLQSQTTTKKEKREITAAFAAGGLAMLLAGGLMSLRWFAKLP